MILHLLSPRRPQPVPISGTLLSVAAHTALVAAVVGSDGSLTGRGSARGSASPTAGGHEGLHWVGVKGTDRPTVRYHQTNARPPIAFVVPGHGATRSGGSRAAAPRSGTAALRSVGVDEGLAVREEMMPRRASVRRARLRLPAPAVPDVDVSVLVAGVLSVAPDLARRVASPEDFTPVPPSRVAAELLTLAAGREPGVLTSDVHARDLPIPLAGNRPPAYPAALAHAGVGGRVVVEFVIDSTGAVDLRSLQVVQSTDARFTEAVRTSLPSLHFVPAMRGEHSVGVTVRQPFVFTVRPGR